MSDHSQGELFAPPSPWPPGFAYRETFLSSAEELDLLAQISRLPLTEAQYREWTAKRRTMSFGGSYDFTHQTLHPAAPVPPFLHPLRARLAEWAGVDAEVFTHGLIAEYQPGTQLGWHRAHAFQAISTEAGAGARDRVHRPASAFRLSDSRRRTMALAARHLCDEGAALFDHLSHAARSRRVMTCAQPRRHRRFACQSGPGGLYAAGCEGRSPHRPPP